MSEVDRRAFMGAAAVGGVAAAVLASSAMAAGQSGYFVIAEIVSKKEKAARCSSPSQNCRRKSRVAWSTR